MKVCTFAAAIFVVVSSVASAQPVRDVADAQEAVRGQIRDMQPALEQLREMTLMLQALGRVQRELSEVAQPGIAIDKARSILDDYSNEAARRAAPIDRDTRALIETARRDLDAARSGGLVGNANELRERIHHNVIHPLQRRAVQMMARVDGIVGAYEGVVNTFRMAESGLAASVGGLSLDPEKP